ncbi:hypothetical protein [Rhodopila globiformis]|uniref:Uncharacterized protein n=1 Tax=Rhodopila globiformis TaxID=1071 RepID=A0A2S6NHE8_RHOGL|nr:hypothetical protein [Rhodopila globiformis]PPQ34062.1 hypothetical protein CCS01_12670 [Rhodopila globiformis]
MDGFVITPTLDSSHLAAAIEDSQDLLRYAARAGIAIPDATINALVHARTCLASGTVPEADTVAFYAAYATLASRVAPVTVDTLRISNEKTRQNLRRNGMLAVALALVVVVFSGISSVTTSMAQGIQAGITHANELAIHLRAEVGPPKPGSTVETGCGPATMPPDPPLKATDATALIAELQDFAATIRTMLRTATKLDVFVADWEKSPLDPPGAWGANAQERLELQPDLINMRKDSFCKIATYEAVRLFAQNVHADSLAIYGAISAYLLPVLYALLGACAYNLRDFSTRVKRRTYHPSSYANTARTIAAMTVGTIISLFNVFNNSAGLQPLAVAFLAGYGVEAFFAFLDALLTAFSNRGRPAPPAAAA